MNKFTALLLLCFASQISARCFLGVCTDKCQDNAPKAGQCAILFDEPKCNSEKFIVADNGKSDIEVSEDLEEDAESIAVRRGCTLEVFNDDDCTGKSFTFSARNDKDLFIKDIEDGDDDDYEDEGLDFVDTDDLDDFGKFFQEILIIIEDLILFFSLQKRKSSALSAPVAETAEVD